MNRYATHSDDMIFATAIQYGKELKNIRLSGITSLQQLFDVVRRELAGYCGMITIKLRNWSQGWSFSRLMRLVPPAAPEGLQLSLF